MTRRSSWKPTGLGGTWLAGTAAAILCLVGGPACAQSLTDRAAQPIGTRTDGGTERPAIVAVTVDPPGDYVIGPEDQLSVVFFQNHDMSAEVVVRSDGKITLPLINDVQASGKTPDQLRSTITTEAKRFMQDPNATVVVRQINSRKVFITGAVERPGTYSINSPTTVLQLIAMASGLKEFADSSKIVIIRSEPGRQARYSFNYKDAIAHGDLRQNIVLRPGDTVVVR